MGGVGSWAMERLAYGNKTNRTRLKSQRTSEHGTENTNTCYWTKQTNNTHNHRIETVVQVCILGADLKLVV